MAGNKHNWDNIPKEQKEYTLIINENKKQIGTAGQLIRFLIKEME